VYVGGAEWVNGKKKIKEQTYWPPFLYVTPAWILPAAPAHWFFNNCPLEQRLEPLQ
jgi:hypothetical protein